MHVKLPQNDPGAAKRAEKLRAERTRYRYAYDWPVGVATGAELHKRDNYSLKYAALSVENYAKLGVNMVAMAVEDFDGKKAAKELEARMKSVSPENLAAHIFSNPQHIAKSMPDRRPETWDEYRCFFATVPDVEVVAKFDGSDDDRDRAFAWQRIAGVNPMVLERCTELPSHFAVDDTRYGALMGGDTLAAAAAEHRLYLADYAMLDGLQAGVSEGIQKHIAAPIALFAVHPTSKQLRPVAIQMGQAPGSAMVYPDGSWAWRAAQMAVQIADANVHEGIAHLGRTHMVMEAVGLAVQRQLAPSHPLHKLLVPHLETTAAINHSAKTSLIAPGGVVDTCFAAQIDAFGAVVHSALASYPIDSTGPLMDLATRGLDDDEALPEHPYRDDVRLIAKIVSDYVGEYIDLYYAEDADVIADYEVQGFVNELGANDGGRLRGVGAVHTVAALKALVTRFVYIAGPGHSCVNFPQFPYMGYAVNMPGASFGPIPTGDVSEAQYIGMLPPHHIAIQGLSTIYILSATRDSTFGHYGKLAFEPRVLPVLARLRSRLDEAEKTIAARDTSRFMSYPYLLPSQILQSISI